MSAANSKKLGIFISRNMNYLQALRESKERLGFLANQLLIPMCDQMVA